MFSMHVRIVLKFSLLQLPADFSWLKMGPSVNNKRQGRASNSAKTSSINIGSDREGGTSKIRVNFGYFSIISKIPVVLGGDKCLPTPRRPDGLCFLIEVTSKDFLFRLLFSES